jgi:hypothetical protein
MSPTIPVLCAATLSRGALSIPFEWQMDYQIPEFFDVESQVNTETQLIAVYVFVFIEELFCWRNV